MCIFPELKIYLKFIMLHNSLKNAGYFSDINQWAEKNCNFASQGIQWRVSDFQASYACFQ